MTLARVLMELARSGDIIITHTNKTMNIEVNSYDISRRDIENPVLLIAMFTLLNPYLVSVDNGTIYNNVITSTYKYNGKTVRIFE